MQLVYTNPNPTMVWHAKNVLASAGIACVIQNQFASGAAGQISPFDAWPELWVLCDNTADGVFGICWKCSR